MKNLIFILAILFAIQATAQTVNDDKVQIFVCDSYKAVDDDGELIVKEDIRIVQGQSFIVIENKTLELVQTFQYNKTVKAEGQLFYEFEGESSTLVAAYDGNKIMLREIPIGGSEFHYIARLKYTVGKKP